MRADQIVRLGAGILTGKLEKELLDRVKVSYDVAGIDIAKIGVGLAQATFAEKIPAPYDAREVIEVAGVTMAVDELAKKVIEVVTPAQSKAVPTAVAVKPTPVTTKATPSLTIS